MDVKVEGITAELWAKQLGSGRGGVVGRACRSAVELTKNDGRRNVELWSGGWRV